MSRATVRKTWSAWLAGESYSPNHDLSVIDPWTGDAAAHVPLCTAEDVERAIAAAFAARSETAAVHAHERSAVLRSVAGKLRERADEFATAIMVEAGKPIQYAQAEVERAIDTFDFSADVARQVDAGRVLDLSAAKSGVGFRAMTRRVPVGVCSFITPFNFPLNLVAHKVAPAIAAGCPFILKPADKTPLSALLLGEVLAEAAGDALVPASWSILPAMPDAAKALVRDERIALLSFTGSDKVGWQLKAEAGKKRVHLELGGNAACIIDETMAGELDRIIDRLTFGAFYQSGQSCISVQRVLVHRDLFDAVHDRLVERARSLPTGDPADHETINGPMIRPDSCATVRARIDAAVQDGAKLLCGGEVSGAWANILSAAVVENVPSEAELWREEAFGPVVCLKPFDEFEQALRTVNDSRFGLQVGVFTQNLARAMRAWELLEVAGVIVGDVPSWRCDPMPYGGVKDSGLGREGPLWMVHELTHQRLLALRT